MRVLVVNAGSSTTKCSVLGPGDETLRSLELPAPGHPEVAPRLQSLLAELEASLGPDALQAVGHRIVHGGPRFSAPVLVDEDVEHDLRGLGAVAPLHNPPALALVDLVRSLRPGLPAVACFDTAFFARLPPEAATYALPEAWRQGLGIRRYGFHGLSHAYAVRRAAELVPGAERLVTCHLGSGASLAAVARGRPVDTTMGFTPLEGLVMATRAGSVDPGALVFVLRHSELSVAAVEEALERRSGLVGLAGTPDLRAVIERADRGDATAALAFGVYLHRLRAGIAAMAAALGGIDVLVFTGGAGWRSARLRAEACAPLGFLGVELDEAANAAEVLADRVVSPPGARVGVVVVEAREDLEIAAATRAVLRARGGRGPGATECSG